MCGIAAIINYKGTGTGNALRMATAAVRHRGPDDEGFLTYNGDGTIQTWSGADTALSTRELYNYPLLKEDQNFIVGLGHRRLSILDLSPKGHQPMVLEEAGLALTFNGEIYNYLELKETLITLGHQFENTTDTEVILHAWAEWGPDCLERFNGMFAFVLVDYKKEQVYAIRDRFGVKPLYYSAQNGTIVFASEIKQIKSVPGFSAQLNEQVAERYLALGLVDVGEETFDIGIAQVPGGSFIHIRLGDPKKDYELVQWYHLSPKAFSGNFSQACEEFKALLTDAVRLRLRSDVTVGSCLSGGLDSSAIVCLAAGLLKNDTGYIPQETVTARFDIARFDEWAFAEEVIKATRSRSHQTFPSFRQLEKEFQQFLWHQDEPTGSSSQFSQWAVFKKTGAVGLKVMIDGQGADEQLAGYGGNEVSLYAGYLRKAQLRNMFTEIKAYRKDHQVWPWAFMLGAVQVTLGKTITSLFPDRWRLHRQLPPGWLTASGDIRKLPLELKSLQRSLTHQVLRSPLPSLLRYEDRSSMAFSVESRTPFMDYRLVEFTLGLPPAMVFGKGTRKKILRESMKGTMPDKIVARRDKMGFVTPEEVWFRGEGNTWFKEGLGDAIAQRPDLFNAPELWKTFKLMTESKIPFDWTFWRILSFGRFLNMPN